MSNFTNSLNFIKTDKGLILQDPLTFYYNNDLTGEYIIIPKGYLFNGASIPKWIQKVFKFDPYNIYWLRASIVHDALVGEFCIPIKIQPSNKILTWKESSAWFNKALKVTEKNYKNCPKIYRKSFVISVNLYGYFFFLK